MDIKSLEESFLTWLATTRTGSIFKVGLGAVLAYVAESVSDWSLPPVVAGVIIVLVPVIINELNPADSRYGIKTDG